MLDTCFGKQRLNARNDICHIIGLWYDLVLECYNRDLPNFKKFKNFGGLYRQIINNQKVEERASLIISNYGMTVDDIMILFNYKLL